jgi:hypothetical protein
MHAIHVEVTITTEELKGGARRTVIVRSLTELEGAVELVVERALETIVPALELPEGE